MAEHLTCDCGRVPIDEYEVRVDWRGIHAVNGCDLDEREYPDG